MGNKKIVLIQVWIGNIPDYFWYHYESTRNLYGVDFLIFTDQNLKLDADNYKVFPIDIYGLERLLYDKTKRPIKILSNKKVCWNLNMTSVKENVDRLNLCINSYFDAFKQDPYSEATKTYKDTAKIIFEKILY